MTPVFVEVEGGLTAFVNPACFAVDAGTSALVEGFDAEDEASAAVTKKLTLRAGRRLRQGPPRRGSESAFSLARNFLKEGGLKPDRARGDSIRVPAGFGEEGSPTAGN